MAGTESKQKHRFKYPKRNESTTILLAAPPLLPYVHPIVPESAQFLVGTSTDQNRGHLLGSYFAYSSQHTDDFVAVQFLQLSFSTASMISFRLFRTYYRLSFFSASFFFFFFRVFGTLVLRASLRSAFTCFLRSFLASFASSLETPLDSSGAFDGP